LPAASAKLNAPVDDAVVASVAPLLAPTAIAPVKSPLALANVLSPIPIAKLVGVLVHAEPPELPALIPLIDAHVAPADPAEPNVAAPAAAATSSTPPASLCPFMVLLLFPFVYCQDARDARQQNGFSERTEWHA